MKQYLLIGQIVVAVFLIVTILLQNRGSAFSGSELFSSRRGLEKQIFISTIILSILFIALALLNLIVR